MQEVWQEKGGVAMTRSRKKHPMWTDNPDAGEKKSWKKIFNRRIRRSQKTTDISNGCEYKKLNNSYDICDYKWFPYDEEIAKKAGRK